MDRRLGAAPAASTLAAVLVFLGALSADGGCSPSSDDPPGPPPCSITSPVQDEFCDALATYFGRCGHCQDCTSKNLQNCTKRSAAISAAHRAAFIACKDTMECSDNPSESPCVHEEMTKATPTPAQLQAKDAYCQSCGPAHEADCENFFTAAPVGASGAGYTLLLSGDDTATKAVSSCSSKCVPFDYAVCVALILCGDSGGDFCVDSGFCAPQ